MSDSTPVILVTGGCGYLGSQSFRDLAVLVDHQEQDSITRLSLEVDAMAFTELDCPPQVTLHAGMAELLDRFTDLSSAGA